MWAIKEQSGRILPHSIRRTRREAIAEVDAPPTFPWSRLYRVGYRAVWVRVEDATLNGRLAA